MGALDFPSRHKTGKAKSRGKKIWRRTGVRFDMTPMVDIAFLLLIFYMVTTVFSMPQSLEFNLPPKTGRQIDVPASRVLQLLVDKNGDIFWRHAESPEHPMDIPEYVAWENLQTLLFNKNLAKANLITIVQIDPQSRYEMLVTVLDDIRVVERLIKQINPEWSYTFSLQDMTEWEAELIAKAKQSMETAKSHERGGIS